MLELGHRDNLQRRAGRASGSRKPTARSTQRNIRRTGSCGGLYRSIAGLTPRNESKVAFGLWCEFRARLRRSLGRGGTQDWLEERDSQRLQKPSRPLVWPLEYSCRRVEEQRERRCKPAEGVPCLAALSWSRLHLSSHCGLIRQGNVLVRDFNGAGALIEVRDMRGIVVVQGQRR
jgi:hypothetical protein